MCAGALVHVRMRRVVFGCASLKDGAAGGVVDLLQHPKLNHRCEVVRGIREGECAEMLKAFFRERRDEIGFQTQRRVVFFLGFNSHTALIENHAEQRVCFRTSRICREQLSRRSLSFFEPARLDQCTGFTQCCLNTSLRRTLSRRYRYRERYEANQS